jgi:aarF domain-containing kinase
VRQQANGGQQLVLLDHGLYIQESDKFREAYCRLWKAIFLMDIDTMSEICKGWGIR